MQALQLRVEQCLSQGRNVVVVGDLNICPQPLDSCCPDPEFYKGRRDRQWLRSLLAQGGGPFVDSFRQVLLLGACAGQAGADYAVLIHSRVIHTCCGYVHTQEDAVPTASVCCCERSSS